MKIGALFAGIGGLERGLERGLGDGARVAWQIEISSFGRRVLAAHWPDAVRLEDVRTAPYSQLEPVDVVCGGFPCQDISVAGRGAGLTGPQSRLFFAMVEALRVLRPAYVVIENSPALRTRGLDIVLAELHAIGYCVEYGFLGAGELAAPHGRRRIWLLASRRDVPPAHFPAGVEFRLDVWPRSLEEFEPWERGIVRGLPRDGAYPFRRKRLNALGAAVVPPVAELLGAAIAAAGTFRLEAPRARLEARHAVYPMPTVCGNHNRAEYSARSGDGLATAVLRRWPTPTSQDAKNDGGNSQLERNSAPLNALVEGLLNPAWVELLMGFPLDWSRIE